MITPLITIVKSPRVRIFMGSVIRIRNGLRSILTMPRNNATHNAEKKLRTVIPGIT
jgi:hypothetical protein